MGLGINLLAVCLAYCTAASALIAPFLNGKISEYKYYGDVKAGIIEPAAYASQFALEALLRIKPDTSDETLENAYQVSLTDVKAGIHNGVAAHYEPTKVLKPIGEKANAIERPFLIVFDEIGKLQGVKISEDEPGWSRNMKMAMASMLQLDLANVKMERPLKPQSFITKENTIHGNCWINYDVHAKNQFDPNPDQLIITKFTSPQNCTGFVVNTFNHVDSEVCQAAKEEPVNVASRRVYEIEKRLEGIIIKKLVAHGGSNYFPWNSRSEAHYVLNNATLTLERQIPISEMTLPMMNFRDIPLTRDLSYRKPTTRYAPDAGIDVTQGRRVVEQTILVPKLKKLLIRAADYIEENHLEAAEPDWKHGQTINRMLLTMSYMTTGSFEQVYNDFQDSTAPRDVTIKNIFLDMITQVGTPASCLFALGVVRKQKVTTPKAIAMLVKLPLNVRLPSSSLLVRMEDLAKLDTTVPTEIRQAAILCYSSMIHEFAKHTDNPDENEHVVKYTRQFFDLLNSESSYEMKVVYLMAMRNIEFGKIHELLAPVVSGEMEISDKPVHLRLLAIWAIEKSIARDYNSAHNLLWPVMADLSLPVKLRIAAYEILMHQAPAMSDVLHIYWFMVYEKNEHLYNYHYTTLNGIANSVDPCKLRLREMTRKIMRYTRVHETIRYATAYARIYDFKEERYNYAQKLRTGVVLNEFTGVPEVVLLEHVVTEARKPFEDMGIRAHVEGFDEIVSLIKRGQAMMTGGLTDSSVLELLKQARMDVPASRKMHVDLVVMHRGRVVLASHYNEQTINKVYNDVKRFVKDGKDGFDLNHQQVGYSRLYEKQVTSEMGLPVVFENRVPILASLRINYRVEPGTEPAKMTFNIDARVWRHGDYSITTYNPLADVWHSIRRATAVDLSLPIHAIVTYYPHSNSIKMTLPIQPATASSIGGVLSHAKDCVTLDYDDSHVEVSKSPDAKKNYLTIHDSKDSGLQYTTGVFDCENGVTPITVRKEWFRAFTSERKNDWNDWVVHGAMAIAQKLQNTLISPNMGSCGGIIKIQPSVVHSTSQVDIRLHGSSEDVDPKNTPWHPYPSLRYNIKGTVDVIAAATNVSMRSWVLNVNVDVRRGHLMNKVKILLTRKTPGERNFKICIDAQKEYTAPPSDPLKVGVTREESNTKVTIAAEETGEEACPREGMFVMIKIKGELSEEQKEKLNNEIITGACAADARNPLYANPKKILPKTLSCLETAIRYTSFRKYTINVKHEKVLPEVASKIYYLTDVARTSLAPNLEYTMTHVEPETARIIVKFPVEKEQLNVSLAAPERSYDLLEVDLKTRRFEGFGPVRNPVWYFPLDNTRFSIPALYSYAHESTKLCSIYTETVLTGDGKSVPFHLTDQWTLVSGDHLHQRFAIFAKTEGAGMSIKLYVEDHVVQVSSDPTSGNARVTIDGNFTETLNNGLVVPSDPENWLVKVTKSNDHVIVQVRKIPITAVYATNHVALAIDTHLQGKVSGLCGHLDGTYVEGITKSYRIDMTTP